MKQSLVYILVSVLLGGLPLGCTTTRPTPSPAEAPISQSEYVIGAGDVLRVVVWKNPEISGEVPVRTDGMISVPLIDDVQAEGLTPTQLKEAITEKLDAFISAPDVTVVVLQPVSKRVYVLGEVARSGPVPVQRDLRVTDAIAWVGGFAPFADKGDIKVVRRMGVDEIEFKFDYDAYVAGRAPGTNILLHPGDTVIVPE